MFVRSSPRRRRDERSILPSLPDVFSPASLQRRLCRLDTSFCRQRWKRLDHINEDKSYARYSPKTIGPSFTGHVVKEVCHTELCSFVYHGNRPGVRRTTPSPESRRSIALVLLRWLLTQPRRCFGQMLISRHRAEISADRLCTVFFCCRDSKTTSLILFEFHRHR